MGLFTRKYKTPWTTDYPPPPEPAQQRKRSQAEVEADARRRARQMEADVHQRRELVAHAACFAGTVEEYSDAVDMDLTSLLGDDVPDAYQPRYNWFSGSKQQEFDYLMGGWHIATKQGGPLEHQVNTYRSRLLSVIQSDIFERLDLISLDAAERASLCVYEADLVATPAVFQPLTYGQYESKSNGRSFGRYLTGYHEIEPQCSYVQGLVVPNSVNFTFGLPEIEFDEQNWYGAPLKEFFQLIPPEALNGYDRTLQLAGRAGSPDGWWVMEPGKRWQVVPLGDPLLCAQYGRHFALVARWL